MEYVKILFMSTAIEYEDNFLIECSLRCMYCVIVISRYEDDIVVITQDHGGAKVERNNNDIIRVNGI